MLVAVVSLSYALYDLHPLTTSRRANWFYATLGLSLFTATLVYVQIMHHPFFAATFVIASLVPALLVLTLPININKGSVKLYEEADRSPELAAVAARERARKISNAISPFGGLGMNTAIIYGILLSIFGYIVWHVDQRCVQDKWETTTIFYEMHWFHWTHPLWHLITAFSSLFFDDAMLKVRLEYFISPLVRKDLTGSFVSRFSFTSSVKLLLGLKRD